MDKETMPNGASAAVADPAAQVTGGMTLQPAPGISADEIALYDRQIRLWGVQAQERLRLADVLLIGMRGLGNEIAKNLILAGINSLTMVDDNLVTEDDLGAQFFLSSEHIGQVRSQACLVAAKSLNPRVNVYHATLAPFLSTPSFFGAYTMVIAADQTLPLLTQINVSCRMCAKPFYAASTFGLYGFIFADLIQHTYSITREKSNVATVIGPESVTRSIISASIAPRNAEGKQIETVTKTESYCPINLANTSPLPAFNLSTRRRKFAVSPILSCIRALWDYQTQTANLSPTHSPADLQMFTKLAKEKHQELQLPAETLRAETLKSFCQNLESEISPVCAFLGGQLAQDVINVLGGREQPVQNFVVFDGEDLKGSVYCLFTDMDKALREAAAAAGVAPAPAPVPVPVPVANVAADPNVTVGTAAGGGTATGAGETVGNGNGVAAAENATGNGAGAGAESGKQEDQKPIATTTV